MEVDSNTPIEGASTSESPPTIAHTVTLAKNELSHHSSHECKEEKEEEPQKVDNPSLHEDDQKNT